MADTNKSANAIAVVPSLDIIKDLYKIGSCPDALFYLFLSPPGCGKTSWMRANMARESFLLNARMYGENTASIPVVAGNNCTIEDYIAARAEVKEHLSALAEKDPDFAEIMTPEMVERFTESKLHSIDRDVHMRAPRYFELENFLLKYDKEVYDSAKKNVPIIWVDEATQATVEARDQLITALVDGVLMDILGIKWKPMVIMLANGKAFGGANNYPLSPRQVARCVQFIYVPEGSEDIPVNTPGINSMAAKKLRQEYHQFVVEGFQTGRNALSKNELPSNHPGNPRAQNVMLWYTTRVKALKIYGPESFMSQIVNGYMDSAFFEKAMGLVKMFFTNMPATIEEVRGILTGKTKMPPNLKGVTNQEWQSWAAAVTDGSATANLDLSNFLRLLKVDEETCKSVETQR